MLVVRRPDPLAQIEQFGDRLRQAQRAAAVRARGPHEGWWRVGAEGSPAFGSGWGNVPANFYFGNAPVGFFKDSDSIVWFRGVLYRRGTAWTRPAFTLPVGYRPSHKMLLVQPSLGRLERDQDQFGEEAPIYRGIQVLPNGELRGPDESKDFPYWWSYRMISLSGFHFRAAG